MRRAHEVLSVRARDPYPFTTPSRSATMATPRRRARRRKGVGANPSKAPAGHGRNTRSGWLQFKRNRGSFLDFAVARLRSALAALPGGRRRQSFVTAIQSTSTSKGPVHSGTQKKMRAGGFFGKKRL